MDNGRKKALRVTGPGGAFVVGAPRENRFPQDGGGYGGGRGRGGGGYGGGGGGYGGGGPSKDRSCTLSEPCLAFAHTAVWGASGVSLVAS